MRNLLQKVTLIIALTFFMGAAMAQGFVKGTVVDADNNETLLGASVVVKGTTMGVSTGLSGTFNLEVPAGAQTIIVQFVGFTSQEFTVNVTEGQTVDLGTIVLAGSQVGLQEVSVFASLAIDRKTPVAISTISSQLIEDKLGSQEFPEILKSTPGVYATKSGGGFGDGRINLRGFNSENVAVMINGVPVNDMENGRVYWSNWAGLADVTRTMQVQRGLGASKVAVPSIGGTINIVSKTTDIEEGGNITTSVGGDGYQKIGATVSTGLLSSGWAVTVSGAKTVGDGYVDGTEFKGYNYFLNISKNIGASHRISLTSFGAPQRHGQRQSSHTIETYRNAESGNRFNSDWGIRGGQVVHVEDNFYHKSQTSFNHYWTISDKSTLSTAFYASFGTGGGGGKGGDAALFNIRLGNDDQPMDIDNIVNTNIANGALGAVSWLRASRNDHNWFGVLSTFNTELGESLDFTAGLDLRTYSAQHFYEVTDLLGASYIYNEDDDINNPNAVLRVGDKYNYNNDGNVGWQGLFTQVEYDKNDLAAFISASVSNTSYQRVDYFKYLDSDPMQTSDKYNFAGFSLKGGANYNISAKSNLFANIGYFEKAAGFDAVFLANDNENINENAVNQKIFSMELGYGYRGEKLAGNLNIYRTKWNDRTFTDYIYSNDIVYYANLIGVNALHQGVELDFTYKMSKKLSAYGMLSIGDWRWDNNVEDVQIYDENQVAVGDPYNLFIEDVKVSDAAQTTAAVGFDYQVMPKTNFTVDFNYFADLYASYNPDDRTEAGMAQPWKIPAFSTVDASIRYGFNFGGFDAVLIARMNNVFDTEYIADARDGSGDAATASVWYGFGRTFNISAKINF